MLISSFTTAFVSKIANAIHLKTLLLWVTETKQVIRHMNTKSEAVYLVVSIGADNSRPVSFAVSTWEWVYVTNVSRLKRETRECEKSKRLVVETRSVVTTAIILPQRLSCYCGKIVSLRMLTNLWLADLRVTTAQQRSTGQNLPSDLYMFNISRRSAELE
jgi:hypothetical protein